MHSKTKTSLDRFNSILKIAEEKHSTHDDIIIQAYSAQEEKRLRGEKKDHNIRGLWNNIRWPTLHVIGAPVGKEGRTKNLK